MKNILCTLVVLAMVLVGCTNNNLKELPDRTQPVAAPANDTTTARQSISYKDPCLFGGSTILNYLFALLRVQDYTDAVDRLTSKSSIAKYGRAKILDFYKSINVDYSPVLLSVVRHGKDSASLRYQVRVMATSRFVDVKTILENDTARIILPIVCKASQVKYVNFLVLE